MWAGLMGNTEKVAGKGVCHNSDCQEGVRGGLRTSRNKKSRWRDGGAQGVVMATWFWLLRAGAVVRLRNCVVVIRKTGLFNMERV